MFTKTFVSALLASLAVVSVHADPNPTAPGPGDSFNEGTQCSIAWDADTSGVWKVMNIELMSGSNLNMNHITTVATVDGTDPTKSPFTYPCPSVTPNSAIYFYQFTSPASTTTYWTTRFTIADATGKSVPPANPTQPGGQAIPWGIGALTDPSLATPAPGKGNSSVAASGSGTSSGFVTSSLIATSTSTPSVPTSSFSSPSAVVTDLASSTDSSSSSSASPSTSANGAASNGGVSVDVSMVKVVGSIGLGFLAAAFAL